jgi:hypothetical protein
LTTLAVPNIITQDPWERRPGGRHRLGTVAGFRSEKVAGFISECMAGFVGIRTSLQPFLAETDDAVLERSIT